jgi:hypothetical protein
LDYHIRAVIEGKPRKTLDGVGSGEEW